MAKHTFAIIGASGKIGHVLTEELLKKGHKVHAIGRDKNKLQKCKEKGAEIFISSFDNASELAKAFKGAQAVFSFIPPAITENDYGAYQDKVGEAIKKALIEEKIQHVLNLSSVGAQLSEGVGLIKGLHRHEKRLNAIPGLNVLHFRPGYFMENMERSIPMIKAAGFNGMALRPDLRIPMIATHDIGIKCAEFLDALNFKGQSVFEFIGPHAFTPVEATAILGKAIGKPDLKYKQLSVDELEKGMAGLGLKPATIKLMLDMYKAFNEEKVPLTQQMTPEHKGKTTIEEYAKTFAQLYHNTKQLASAKH